MILPKRRTLPPNWIMLSFSSLSIVFNRSSPFILFKHPRIQSRYVFLILGSSLIRSMYALFCIYLSYIHSPIRFQYSIFIQNFASQKLQKCLLYVASKKKTRDGLMQLHRLPKNTKTFNTINKGICTHTNHMRYKFLRNSTQIHFPWLLLHLVQWNLVSKNN